MTEPFTTGAGAKLLGVTEPQLGEQARRGRITPAPTIMAGRRLWSIDQLRQAAKALGLPDPFAPKKDTSTT